MEDNVYEFSFALTAKQGLGGSELSLLGELFIVLSKYGKIPMERVDLILDHIKQVNAFMVKEEVD